MYVLPHVNMPSHAVVCPRIFNEQQPIWQEVEATIANLVERGVMAESEIVASLQQVLPEQFQQLIPSELRNVAPQSPAVAQQQAQEAFYEEPPLSAEQLSISQSGMQLQQHCFAADLATDAVNQANACPGKLLSFSGVGSCPVHHQT